MLIPGRESGTSWRRSPNGVGGRTQGKTRDKSKYAHRFSTVHPNLIYRIRNRSIHSSHNI